MPFTAIAAGVGAAGSIAGGAIGASAAGSAADTQANAAIQASQIQAQQADKALQFQKQQYQTGQAQLSPYLQAGYSGLANLENLLGLPVSGTATLPGAAATPVASRGGMAPRGPVGRFANSGLDFRGGGYQLGGGTTPGVAATTGGLPTHTVNMASLINPGLGARGSLNFQAPQLNNTTDPGYQARLQLGTQAIENSAAARGNLLSGGEQRALTDYAQNYASNEYQNVYNRALQGNMLQYNRLASLAGIGQQTGANLVGAGNQSANSIANTLLTLGQQQGQAYQNAGAARASGTVGAANAWGGTLGSLGQYASLIPLLQMFNQQQGNQNVAGIPMDPTGNIWNPQPGSY